MADAENAAVLYAKAFPGLRHCHDDDKFVDIMYKGLNEWSDKDVEAIEKTLAEHGEAMRLLREAGRRLQCRYDLDYTQRLTVDKLMHFADLRGAVRLLALKARLDAKKGKGEAALKSCCDALRVVRSLDSEPILLLKLLKIAVAGITIAAMKEGMDVTDAPPGGYRQVLGELHSLERRDLLVKSFEHERCLVIATVRRWRREPDLLTLTGYSPGQWETFVWSNTPVSSLDAVCYLRAIPKLMDVVGRPFYATTSDREAMKEAFSKIPRPLILSHERLSPHLRSSEAQAALEAKCRLARTALALRIYKSQHGRYPDTLNALAPAILSKVPVDPFSGKLLIYRREGKGFVFYSVSVNGRDDGGKAADIETMLDWRQKDIVWRSEK